jgi:hypothetical protein
MTALQMLYFKQIKNKLPYESTECVPNYESNQPPRFNIRTGSSLNRVSRTPVMKKRHAIVAVLVLAAVYVGGYFLLVRPAGPYTTNGVITIKTPVVQGGKMVTLMETCPDYRGVPERLFRPLHYLDTKCFRSSLWYTTSSVAWPKSTLNVPDHKVEIE